uniref:SpoVT-AbrB domain-containing protein n=2 Tax=Thermoproteati TaxID=1783275 RepID=E6NAL8_CALS0|nr:conserved hypothetical protein [Candidatus Caldarchaeum subterraneum]BAL57030.1 phosphate transport system regulatory protein [uncultured crenarchaeote]
MAEIEHRNLQKIKGGSYVITLPRKWVEGLGLRKGERVVMIRDSLGLRITPETGREMPTVEVSKKEVDDIRFLRYLTFSYYMQGVEKVILRADDGFTPEERRELRRIASELVGADIMEDAQNRMVFRFLTKLDEENFFDRLTRMMRFAYEIHRDTYQILRERNISNAAEIVERIGEVLKQYRVTFRVLSLTLLQPTRGFPFSDVRLITLYAALIRDLFMTVYYATQIAKSLIDLGAEPVEENIFNKVLKMYEIVVKMYERVFTAFTEGATVNDIFQNSKAYSEIEKLDQELSVSRDFRLIVLARNVRRAGGYAIALSDILVNKLVVEKTSPFTETKPLFTDTE